MLWVGTCGFAGGQGRAFRDLQVVEIQSTFYRAVAEATARRWRAAAPAGFRFTVKASQFITHPASSPTYRRSGRTVPEDGRSRYGGFQDTPEVREGWEATAAVAGALKAEVLVFQTPASFRPSEDRIRDLYAFFESTDTKALRALELRGPWAPHLVARICEDLGLVHAVDPFDRESATTGLAYFRLHGSPPGPRRYDYAYTDEDLARLRAIAREYDDAYVLFNNMSMHADAVRFRRSLGDLPPVSASASGSRGERFL